MSALAHAPTILSLLRLPLAGLFFLVEGAGARMAVIAAAAGTDFADGFLARRYDLRTRTGAILDPITDKTFLLSVLFAYAAWGELSLWHLLLLVVRDVFAVIGFFVIVLRRMRVRLQARFAGKVVTTLQLAAAAALTLFPAALPPIAWAAGIIGAVAVIDYVRAGLADLRRADGPA